jgi:hypothetical protein
MNAHEALAQVKNMVDATVAEIVPDAELSPDVEEGGTSCESSLSGPTGRRDAPSSGARLPASTPLPP